MSAARADFRIVAPQGFDRLLHLLFGGLLDLSNVHTALLALGSSDVHQRALVLAEHDALQCTGLGDIEHLGSAGADPAQCERRGVHDLQVASRASSNVIVE